MNIKQAFSVDTHNEDNPYLFKIVLDHLTVIDLEKLESKVNECAAKLLVDGSESEVVDNKPSSRLMVVITLDKDNRRKFLTFLSEEWEGLNKSERWPKSWID